MSAHPRPDPTDLPALSAEADWFQLLQLPARFDLAEDEIRSAYRRLASQTHPDRFGGASQELICRATRLSAAVNDAYRTLQDPVSRASYLLQLHGGPGPDEVRDVPGDLLMEVMELREQIEEAAEQKDNAGIDRHRQTVEARRGAALERMKTLARSIENADEQQRKELRMVLNAIRYYDNLLVELARDPLAPPAP
jgi:molecular chaperone HscB